MFTLITLAQQVRPHPDVVDTALEAGETVLLHLEHVTYYSLNSTGTLIWEGLKQGMTLHAISVRLQQQYAVEAEQADRSVLALVHELTHHQLVQPLD
jgi:hypothetical protein